MSDTVPNRKKSHTGRKEEHLRIALNEDTSGPEVTAGFDDYRFIHQALPEIDLKDIDLSLTLFGKTLQAPVVISSMIGGIPAATTINRNLAAAAQALGLAMGIGSQRVAIEDSDTAHTYHVRDVAPDILLFANLGAVQLNYGYGVAECRRAVEIIRADALMLHLNPLQEALQPGGNTNFAHLLRKIELVCRTLTVPVVVKEVGWGISEDVARKLSAAGVAGIDVAGAGGTSWSRIEGLRPANEANREIAEAFSSWGIPTAESVRMVRRAAPGLPLIAGGGIRNGLDAAKAIALGADAVGLATPLLKSAHVSPSAISSGLREIIQELRLAMFCIGARNLNELKDSCFLVKR